MKCRNCGAEFESKFCPECGTRAVVEAEERQTVEKERGAERPEYYLTEADSKVLMCRNGKEEKQISVQSEQSVLDFCESKKYVFYVLQIENNLFNIFSVIGRAMGAEISLYRYAKATGKTEQLTIKGDGYNWPGSIHCTEEYLLLFYKDDDMDKKLLLMNTDGKRIRYIDAEELDVDELCNISIVDFYDNCIWYKEEETLFVYQVDTDTAKKISNNVSLAASDENNVYYLRKDDCEYEAVRCSIEGKDRTIIGRVETSLRVSALTVENGKPAVWAEKQGSYLAAGEKTKVEIKAL